MDMLSDEDADLAEAGVFTSLLFYSNLKRISR